MVRGTCIYETDRESQATVFLRNKKVVKVCYKSLFCIWHNISVLQYNCNCNKRKLYADQKVVLEKQIEKRISMNELYELIEQKIKESGYPREISGEAVYNDICDQIEGKENGIYLLLSKFEEDVIFEYHITIRDEDFNLGILTMRTPEGTFEVDFDA